MLVHAPLLSCVRLFVTPWTVATRLLCPWDFPGKNTGVGCHLPPATWSQCTRNYLYPRWALFFCGPHPCLGFQAHTRISPPNTSTWPPHHKLNRDKPLFTVPSAFQSQQPLLQDATEKPITHLKQGGAHCWCIFSFLSPTPVFSLWNFYWTCSVLFKIFQTFLQLFYHLTFLKVLILSFPLSLMLDFANCVARHFDFGLSLIIFFFLFVFDMGTLCNLAVEISLVQFSCSVMSNSLWPYGLQHARPPCSSPTLGACSNSCPLSRWCHPTIPSSVVPFFSRLQSFPASGSFPMSQFFASGGQSIGISTLVSVLLMNIQLISLRIDWLDLLAVQGTLKSLLQHHSSKASVLWCSASFIVQLSHPYMTTGKSYSFD